MKTLRNRLLFFFLVFNAITIGVIFLFYAFDEQKERYNSTVSLLENTHQLLLKDFIIFEEFLTYETINPLFFNVGQSIYLLKHDELLRKIYTRLDSLENLNVAENLEIKSPIGKVRTKVKHYDSFTKEMVKLIKERGFKDFGLIGSMRENIHELERYSDLNQERILMLRRHEKDFLLRGQGIYVSKHKKLADKFLDEISRQKLSDSKKKVISKNLEEYSIKFRRLAKLEEKIGLRNNTGIKQKTRSTVNEIQFIFDDLIKRTVQRQGSILTSMTYYFLVYIAMVVVISVIGSIYLSKRITLKLSLISNHMQRFVQSEFSLTEELDVAIKEDEVSLLAKNYLLLKDEIIDLISSFKQKVEERTHEISEQKDRIEDQAVKIVSQHENLLAKNKLIENQNKAMLDGIRYAERIQSAVLPAESQLNEIFAHNFIFYKPRDIIGGDFYWMRRIQENNNDISVIAAADSTGHGVPGALMTMLGYAFLNEIILRQNVYEANEILERLRSKIIVAMNYKESDRVAGDGMDIALCVINHKKRTLTYAGANRPLYIVRKSEILYIRGDNFAIGKLGGVEKRFTKQTLPLEEDDNVYLFTDGYADQFGGNTGRKFMRKNIRSLLLEMRSFPMFYQKEHLEKKHNEWRGEEKQVDDILVMGLKVKW